MRGTKRTLALAAAMAAATAMATQLTQHEWQVDGVTRTALAHTPSAAATNPVPVVLVYHGHGGTARHAAHAFDIHTLWPEALVVYLQGLPVASKLAKSDDAKPGWQTAPGEAGDRDLKFTDTLLRSFAATYRIDAKRIFATGHSNGGGFAFLLWAARPQHIAAVAPCAAVTGQLARLKPKPVFHLAGRGDTLVSFAWQESLVAALRLINRCGQPWGKHATVYTSLTGTPVISYVHSGGHELPPEAPSAIVRFFKSL